MINNTVEEIRKHIEEIMDLLKIERTADNEGTPLRVSKMWVNELFANRNDYNIQELNDQMKVFPCEYEDGELTMQNVEFWSMCSHHWLPFGGVVKVSYIADKSVIGISKIPRVVEYFSKRPQLQERLTKEIGDYLFNLINPKYLVVIIEAKHQCVMCRGIRSDSETITRSEWRKNS